MNLVLILTKRDVNLTTRSITCRINLKNKTSEKVKDMNAEENNSPDKKGIAATILRSKKLKLNIFFSNKQIYLYFSFIG